LELPGHDAQSRASDPEGDLRRCSQLSLDLLCKIVRTSLAPAHARAGTGSVPPLGPDGAFPLSRSAHEWPDAARFPHGGGSPVAYGAEPSQPRSPPAMAPHTTIYRSVASDDFDLPSLSGGAPTRHDPRPEPDAVAPLVQIYGGGHEQSWSPLRLPRWPNPQARIRQRGLLAVRSECRPIDR